MRDQLEVSIPIDGEIKHKDGYTITGTFTFKIGTDPETIKLLPEIIELVRNHNLTSLWLEAIKK